MGVRDNDNVSMTSVLQVDEHCEPRLRCDVGEAAAAATNSSSDFSSISLFFE